MQWFQSKWWNKIICSLNENFFDIFENQVKKITRISQELFDQSAIGSQAEIRDVRLIFERISTQQVRARIEDSAERCAMTQTMLSEFGSRWNKSFRQIIGEEINKALKSRMRSWALHGRESEDSSPGNRGDCQMLMKHIFHANHNIVDHSAGQKLASADLNVLPKQTLGRKMSEYEKHSLSAIIPNATNQNLSAHT